MSADLELVLAVFGIALVLVLWAIEPRDEQPERRSGRLQLPGDRVWTERQRDLRADFWRR